MAAPAAAPAPSCSSSEPPPPAEPAAPAAPAAPPAPGAGGGRARQRLEDSVALAALGAWLGDPSSDVEKKLSKAMRARHAELDQDVRKEVAGRVLGVAVFRGRLAHLLEREVGAGAGADAEAMLRLFLARGRCVGAPPSALAAPPPPGLGEKLAAAAAAPLFLRDGEMPSAEMSLAAEWSLPPWLAERWVGELGAPEAFALGQAMSGPARVTLRANTLKTTRPELIDALAAVGVRAEPTAESPWGVWLPDGRPPGGGVWQLPGFQDGLFEVQDEGSQLIALATQAAPGERVIDYCAGRGGKTWALASLVAPDGAVAAWDIDEELRLQLCGARCVRAGAAGLVRTCERCPADEPPYRGGADAVLVDAPCSSTGALRRHPSQRWSVDQNSVAALTEIQAQVLREASQCVRPGGRLVYATCSLLRAENAGVACAFEAACGGEFEPLPFSRASSADPHHRTLMPHVEGTDGFFMARWRRRGGGPSEGRGQ